MGMEISTRLSKIGKAVVHYGVKEVLKKEKKRFQHRHEKHVDLPSRAFKAPGLVY